MCKEGSQQADDLSFSPREVSFFLREKVVSSSKRVEKVPSLVAREGKLASYLQIERNPQIVFDRSWHQWRSLLQVGYLAPVGRNFSICNTVSSPENLATIDWVQKRQGSQDQALPRSRRTYQGQPISGLKIDIDAVEEPAIVTRVTPPQVAGTEKSRLRV